MKKFLKDYLGLLAAVGLASGSLFAFNISSSISNALQIIQTILITSDGTESGAHVLEINTGGNVLYSTGILSLDMSGNFGQSRIAINQNEYGIANTIDGFGPNTEAVGFGAFSGADISVINGIVNKFGFNQAVMQYVDNTQSVENYTTVFPQGIITSASKSGQTNALALGSDALRMIGNGSGVLYISNSGEFKQTRGEYTFENTENIQPYNSGYKFAGVRWRSGSMALASGLSFDLMAGLLAAPNDPFPVYALKYMIGDQPYSQMLFEPEDVIFNMNSVTGAAGTTFSFGVAKDGAQFQDTTNVARNVSTQWINSNNNIVMSILNDGTIGIGGDDPQNTLDLSNSVAVPGTLGLRLGAGAGNSGQVLGLDDSGNVVMVGSVGGFGGGGGPNYWTQNANTLYPTTLSNKVGVGITNPSETLQVSGTFLSTTTNAYGVTARLVLDNVGSLLGLPFVGAYANSGSIILADGIDTANQAIGMLSINNSGNTARVLQTTLSQTQGVYCRTAGCNNDSDKNGFQINTNGTTILGYDLSPLGYNTRWMRGITELVRITNDGAVGIGTSNPSETFELSGTLLSTFMNQYGTFGFAGNNTIFGGNPGAGSYATSGNEFVYAGVDHDGNKLSSELVYNSGSESQFIGVSRDGPAMFWMSTSGSTSRNGIDMSSTGVNTFIRDPLIGYAAFTWGTDQGSELMRLNNAGYLGIGVTNPLYTLDVGGMVRIGAIPTVSTTTNVLVESGGVISEISTSILGAGLKSATLVLGSVGLSTINGGGGTTIACPTSPTNYIELLSATFEYDYATTPYAGTAGSIFVFYAGSNETITSNLSYSAVGILGSADRIYKVSGGFESNGSVLLGSSGCLKITGGTPLTGGDGTLRIKVLYKEDTFGQ